MSGLRNKVVVGVSLLCFPAFASSGEEFSDGFENLFSYNIDFCRLQFPLLITETVGANVMVFGRLYIAGLTDQTGLNDPAPEVTGYVGYGPDGSSPPGSWTWFTGMPNPGYSPGSPGHEANNDEYQATLAVPGAPGTYDFAFRFTGDGGATFTYCDGGIEGSSNGYNPAEAGQMTVLPAR